MNANPRATKVFREARDTLLAHGTDLDAARRHFRWPELTTFNWALDWFDVVAESNPEPALLVTGAGGDVRVSYERLAVRSDQVATWLRERGVRRHDPVLVLLHNRPELWEVLLAAIKLGAVVVPTYATATPSDLADRMSRAQVRHVVAEADLAHRFADLPRGWTPIAIGDAPDGWISYTESEAAPEIFTPDAATPADDPLFCYFTSGTTSKPKMVVHTHTSYPVGHLSGMYWNGVRPGDVHLNISSPGWAKHSWSSFFVPWNAEATIATLGGDPKPDAGSILDVLRTRGISTFCAPPTVWRGLVRHGLGDRPVGLRELVAAGEPLDGALMSEVRRAWDLVVRDGYGQTETTAQVGNPPGRTPVGNMGWPLPGYRIEVRDRASGTEVGIGDVGELCVSLSPAPAGVMPGYLGDDKRTETAFEGGYYHTGDLVRRNDDGSLTFIGRDDDMFKSFDHRISPLELEKVLLSHPAVAEAAVVPSPHPVGDWEPKAFVVLARDVVAGKPVAESVFAHVREELPEEKWVALLRFVTELPRTSSGKTRRAALRELHDDGREQVFRIDSGVPAQRGV